MTAEDVLEVLDRLDAAGIQWWLDGGWGVDALLGEETREHHDLDFAIGVGDIQRLPAAFPEFVRIHEDHWPAAYVLRDRDGRELDFHPLEFDEHGNGWQPQANAARSEWPKEALAARGWIGGREVRCTSPEFQVASHLYEGFDDIDHADIRLLCERFALDHPPAAAEPRGFIHQKRRAQ